MIKSSTPFKFITIIFIAAFLCIIEQAVSNGSGAPTGATGAPGEGNCTSCHSGSPVSNSSVISVFTNMTNGQYIPDSTYQITLRASSTGCSKFGFSTTMLNNNATPAALGILSVPTASSTVQYSTSASRDYITHTSSGTSAIYTDSTEWIFNWKAPATLSGDAKLYIAVNVTDNSGTNSGDEINLKTITFSQTTNVPVASIGTSSDTICQTDSILFLGSGTNNTTSYLWTFPGGNPSSSTSQNQWVKFSTGTKLCSLRVANSIMNSAIVTKSVIVNANPTGSISYNTATVLCDGDSILLTVANVTGYSYQWQKDANTIQGATASGYYAKASGTYRVLITNTVGGCSITTAPVTLSFNTKPIANLTAPDGLNSCVGDSLRLKATSGTNNSYYWYKDNVLQLQSLDSVFYTKLSGNYFVRVFSSVGCSNQSNSLALSFYNKPTGGIISAIDSICQGDSVMLSVSSADTIASYQWKRNGNTITGATSKNYFALLAGAYTVELTTNRGCKNVTAAKLISVNALPAANFIDSTNSACNFLLKIRNNGNFTFKWQCNGVTINTTDTMITAPITGFYNVIITNPSGCSITTNTLFINVGNAPNVTLTPVSNAVICSDSSGVTYQVPPAPATTYKWFKNGNAITGATQNSLNITDSGNYYVVVDNGICAVPSATRNVTVNAIPTANFIDSVKAGCAYLLKLRNTGIFAFAWMRDGVVINTNDTLITAVQSGTYNIKITNASGCSIFTNSIAINIPLPLPDATIMPAFDATICTDSLGVTYSVPVATGSNFRWFKDGALITGANQNALTIKDSGSYYVIVSTGFCSVTSATRKVAVNLSPVAIASSADTTFCPGDSSILATPNVVNATYQWRRNNVAVPNATSNILIAKLPGSYQVLVTLGGCTKLSNAINVIEETVPPIPVITQTGNVLTSSVATGYQWFKNGQPISGAIQQSYTITSDGNYSVMITGSNGCKSVSPETNVVFTGISNSVNSNMVRIFPNPVKGTLFMVFSENSSYQLLISDAAGREVKSMQFNAAMQAIDFSVWESGVYFIKITAANATQTIRVVNSKM